MQGRGLQLSRKLNRTMQDADYLERFGLVSVDDQVVAKTRHRPEAHPPRRKLRPNTACPWILAEEAA